MISVLRLGRFGGKLPEPGEPPVTRKCRSSARAPGSGSLPPSHREADVVPRRQCRRSHRARREVPMVLAIAAIALVSLVLNVVLLARTELRIRTMPCGPQEVYAWVIYEKIAQCVPDPDTDNRGEAR